MENDHILISRKFDELRVLYTESVSLIEEKYCIDTVYLRSIEVHLILEAQKLDQFSYDRSCYLPLILTVLDATPYSRLRFESDESRPKLSEIKKYGGMIIVAQMEVAIKTTRLSLSITRGFDGKSIFVISYTDCMIEKSLYQTLEIQIDNNFDKVISDFIKMTKDVSKI